MFFFLQCLQVEGPIVGAGGGGSDGSRPSDKRGGAVIQSLRKTGGSLKKNSFRPQFVPKISGGGGGGGVSGPSPGSATGGML